jgi:succinyl-diaminopimelate desuccinylase
MQACNFRFSETHVCLFEGMGMTAFSRVAQRLDELGDECVNFLARICAIPAIGPESGGAGEAAKYEVIREAVAALGPDETIAVHAPDERVPDGIRPNLLVRFKGADRSRTLWILSHIDVVPEGERGLWRTDPFNPVVEDGFLIGRGVEDNGQALAASVFAARAVKETVGFALDVGLALVSDEESGSLYGLDYVLSQRPDLFRPQDLILVPDAGSKEGDHIEIAEKHLYHVRFKVTGLQAHASRPDKGRNTLRAAAHLIVDLDGELPKRFHATNPFFGPPTSTFEPTKKEANVPNINTIPGEDVFYFDCRVLPEEDLDEVSTVMREVAAEVDRKFEVHTTVEDVIKFKAPDPTPSDSPVVVGLAQAVQEVYGIQAKPVGIGGQTVAAFFRRRGLPAAVWQKTLNMAHAPNERISIDDLIANAKVFARMMVEAS